MVARRASGDKGVVHRAGHHIIHRRHRPANRRQRRLQTGRAGMGVSLDLANALFGHGAHHLNQMRFRMGQKHGIFIGLRCLFAQQRGKIGMFQRKIERPQPVGPFGMPLRCVMFQKDGVFVQPGCHGQSLSASPHFDNGLPVYLSRKSGEGPTLNVDKGRGFCDMKEDDKPLKEPDHG
jgi:hypothetical protein